MGRLPCFFEPGYKKLNPKKFCKEHGVEDRCWIERRRKKKLPVESAK